MVTSVYEARNDDNERRYKADVLAFIEGTVNDVREADICQLLELAARTSESARCFRDTVEFLIERLPRRDAVTSRYVFWYMLRMLCATFEAYLTPRVSPDDVAHAKAAAAIASYTRNTEENGRDPTPRSRPQTS